MHLQCVLSLTCIPQCRNSRSYSHTSTRHLTFDCPHRFDTDYSCFDHILVRKLLPLFLPFINLTLPMIHVCVFIQLCTCEFEASSVSRPCTCSVHRSTVRRGQYIEVMKSESFSKGYVGNLRQTSSVSKGNSNDVELKGMSSGPRKLPQFYFMLLCLP